MNKIHLKKGDVEILLEGDAKFVDKHLADFKKLIFIGDTKIDGGKERQQDKKPAKELGGAPGTLLSLYQERKPSTHYDKIAVFGYYLMEKENKATFTAEDLKACYLQMRTATKMPGNLEVTIADTIRNTRYIKRVGRQNLELSSGGINHVLHELPPTK